MDEGDDTPPPDGDGGRDRGHGDACVECHEDGDRDDAPSRGRDECRDDPPPPGRGREVHVTATATAISQYVDADRGKVICFRCGQSGHLRYQCLSYKVRLCWHHQNGRCTDAACTFAHGESELRTPWKPRCVRVVKHDGELVCIGCNSTEHTFRRCPLHQNLLML